MGAGVAPVPLLGGGGEAGPRAQPHWAEVWKDPSLKTAVAGYGPVLQSCTRTHGPSAPGLVSCPTGCVTFQGGGEKLQPRPVERPAGPQHTGS